MPQNNQRPLYIPYAGPSLLEMPLLNKGSAFSDLERESFNLIGLLPQTVETIEEQALRAYQQFLQCESALDKHIYLRSIQDDNETLFFRLIERHLEEMLPIIYTPTVGDACEQFSSIYRNHRGLFIAYPDRHKIDAIIRSSTKDNVRVIVVTDGDRILGLGDQGIGGMGIPIGKLSLYTACGGVSPAYTLPIVLDVGTNNQALLDDPMYMGWRHGRISKDEYNEFVALFVTAVKRRWPKVLLQFEDFAVDNAKHILTTYRDDICSFNDDMQGTAAVCLGSMLAACKAKGERMSEQCVVFAGAGTAGCGIAALIVQAMQDDGLTEAQARRRVYMVDRDGLLTKDSPNLFDFQRELAQDPADLADWDLESGGDDVLYTVVSNAQPSILVGVSGQRGLFSERIIKRMQDNCERPFVMPLSNPTTHAEALPEDVIKWTEGRGFVVSGSPFAPVEFAGRCIPISQCNNSYVFPGIGVGVIAAAASSITDKMFMAAANALADSSPLVVDGAGPLLPPIAAVPAVSRAIGFAVAKQAQADGVALSSTDETIHQAIERNFWHPRYREYRRAAF